MTVHPWLMLDELYDFEPQFARKNLPELSLRKMAKVYFVHFAKKLSVDEAVDDYLHQHHDLMRRHPFADPFDLTPNVREIKKRGEVSLRDLIARVYMFQMEYPNQTIELYIATLRKMMDREPYIVTIRSMLMVREFHMIIGANNAQNFLDYHLQINARDEPEGELHKAKFGF